MKEKSISEKSFKTSIAYFIIGLFLFLITQGIDHHQLRVLVSCIWIAMGVVGVVLFINSAVYWITGFISPKIAAGKGPLGVVLWITWMIFFMLSA